MTSIQQIRYSPVLAGAVLCAALTVTGCSSAPGDIAAVEEAPPLAVTVAQVTTSDLRDTFEAGGVVEARNTASISSRLLAPVLEVRVSPGDRVRSGQVLLVLDGRSLEAQSRGALAQAEATRQRAAAAASDERAAQASLALARATYDRVAALHAKKSATPQELDTATEALRGAEAHLAGASARVSEASSGLDGANAATTAAEVMASYTRIAAPFDGVVAEKLVEPGNMATPGVPLLRLEDTGAFRLAVRVDESRVPQIATGAAVDVRFDAGDGTRREVPGVVSEVSRAVDADARAFLVKVELPADAGVRSGMFGRAAFPGQMRQVIMVPPDAIVRQGQVTSAFVVADGIARLRLVRVRGAEVLAGLSDGETVITSPVAGLTDGRRVTMGSRP